MQIKPVRVGITGGIGAGKSIVCEVFQVLGVPVYNADVRAKQLMEVSHDVIGQIKSRFGALSYDTSGRLNRSFVAKKIFEDKENLEILNGIVHPAVEDDFNKWVSQYSEEKYILKEAALLVETGSYQRLDYLITVIAPEEIRIKRIMERDAHRTLSDIRAIISNQLDEKKKVEVSQFVLNNDGQLLLLPQIMKIHNFLLN